MNEQFEDLMYKAGLTAQGCWDKMDSYDRKAIEKFAELIVRECVDICFSEAEGYGMAFGQHCGIVIKEHFGVE